MVSTEAIDSVFSALPRGATILELGSGLSTEIFAPHYKVHTVEHDLSWFTKKVDGVNYIHAPLVEYKPFFSDKEVWYNPEVLKKELPSHYDMIIVDGPTGSKFSRYGFVHNLSLFKKCPVLFDDIHAVNVYMVMIETMNKWNLGKAEVFNIVNDKAFGWIGLGYE